MRFTKKLTGILLTGVLLASAFTGCGAQGGADVPAASGSTAAKPSSDAFDASNEIGVISREEGSGTRTAFIELFGVEQKDADGNKIDYTTQSAVVTNSTAVMMTTVAGDPYSVGYISLGSLNDTVKALSIDGVAPSVAAIKDGSYKIARPFNIATKGTVSANAQDFIDFIMSADGQAVIEDNGYIAVSDAPAYSGGMDDGKVVISGSSSITPVMEKLKEAYLVKNPNVTIEIQQSDSSTGMSDAIDGVCDIGMASREVKDTELEKGLSATTIAMDGIAVIVNHSCPVDGLTSEQVMKMYTGEVTLWNEVTK